MGYVSGILARNNPSGLALEELESDSLLSPLADSVDKVSCLVSIGGGRPEFKESGGWLRRSSALEGITAVQGALDICSRVTCDTHAEHVKIRKRYVPLFDVLPGDILATYMFSGLRRPGGMRSTSDLTSIASSSQIY